MQNIGTIQLFRYILLRVKKKTHLTDVLPDYWQEYMQYKSYEPFLFMVQLVKVIPVRAQYIDLLVLAFVAKREFAFQVKPHEIIKAFSCVVNSLLKLVEL